MIALYKKSILLFAMFALSASGTLQAADPMEANLFVNLSKQLIPSVVNISTLARARAPRQGRPGDSQDELFRRFFEDMFRAPYPHGNNSRRPEPQAPNGKGPTMPLALGTGFIIDSSGLILTNNHVVAGADEIKIHFTEDDQEEATDGKVVGRDPELDLALIKVNTKRAVVPVKLGDSDALQVGEYVMAVGNPFGQGHSVTHGIISAKGRKSPDFALANYIQTDAPINPGNSGGPLVNLRGEVIGINNAIDQRAQGIGFAIPINLVKQVLPQLKSTGSVARGYIGVQVSELTPEIAQRVGVPDKVKAAFVAHVYPGSPSEKSGVRPYDVITEFNGKRIVSASDLINAVTSVPVNSSASMKLLRGKKELDVKIKVAARPNSAPQSPDTGSPAERESRSAPSDLDRTGLGVESLSAEDIKELGLNPKTRGVIVTELKFEGPADKAGITRGDIIVEVDRKTPKSPKDFYEMVRSKKSYLLRVLRVAPTGQERFEVLVLDLK